MSIWNKILLGFIFLASLAFFYMAVRTLKTHHYWRDLGRQYEDQIARREQIGEVMSQGGKLEIQGLRGPVVIPEGSPSLQIKIMPEGRTVVEPTDGRLKIPSGLMEVKSDSTGEPEKVFQSAEVAGEVKSLADLKTELAVLQPRGRAWFGCIPDVEDKQRDRVTGSGVKVTLSIMPPAAGEGGRVSDEQAENGFPDKKNQLFVFDAAKLPGSPGRYLGEFRVVDTDEANLEITLDPVYKLIPRQVKYLNESLAGENVEWILYERMPADSHLVFAEKSDEDLKAMLPESSIREYLKHGKPADPDDPPERVDGDGNYARKLRDYKVLFDRYHAQRSLLENETESARRDMQESVAAAADAAKHLRWFRDGELAELKQEASRLKQERDALARHRAKLDAWVRYVQKQRDELIARNQQNAAELTRIQKEAAERIDARTRRMAKSGAAGS